MGCYCCGYDDCYEKARLDASNQIITSEANQVQREARNLQAKLEEIVVKPFRAFDVPVWSSGDSGSYLRVISLIKQKRAQEKRPMALGRMLRPHYQAAVKEMQTFCEAQGDIQGPDPVWWVVISTLATHSDDLYELKQDLDKLKMKFHLHKTTAETIKKQLEESGSLKPQESTKIDQESELILEKLTRDVEKFEPFAGECTRLLREFYVEVDEKLVQEAERELREAKQGLAAKIEEKLTEVTAKETPK